MIILILVSFDFWVVKNITGRYLLGLRWWNRTDDGDNEVWVFEYKDVSTDAISVILPAAAAFCLLRLKLIYIKTHFVSPVDSNMFWMSSYIVLSIWIFLALISIIRLNFGWSIICLVAIGMGLINLTAYSKCDKVCTSIVPCALS